MVPIGISQGNNKWFKGQYMKELAPTWPMLKMNQEDYDKEFFKILSKLDAREIYDNLPDNAVLLCYEKFNDKCHRRAVAEWLEKELGIEVCEYGLKREESFPYAECCEANKGKLRKPENKEQPKQEYQGKMSFEEWMKSGIGGTRPDLFDVEQLPAVKARRASMKREQEKKLGGLV
ncbi:DUF488 domain-containing protein [Cytobacillus depressus]|uniref:DUF488 domain-containing protein n=2 Tax=Cytobacillus depressus TaxID=1602942 RepID=A0A6L3UZU0_9BACI|nr:DUF488 domain-containing protein [Cytobacillus depressus]